MKAPPSWGTPGKEPCRCCTAVSTGSSRGPAGRGAPRPYRPSPDRTGIGVPAAALVPPRTSVSTSRDARHFLPHSLSPRPRQPHGPRRVACGSRAAAGRPRHPHGDRGASGGEALTPRRAGGAVVAGRKHVDSTAFPGLQCGRDLPGTAKAS